MSQAIAQRETWLEEVRRGTYQRKQKRPEPAKEITCCDLWDAYKKNCATRKVKRMDRAVFTWKQLS